MPDVKHPGLSSAWSVRVGFARHGSLPETVGTQRKEIDSRVGNPQGRPNGWWQSAEDMVGGVGRAGGGNAGSLESGLAEGLNGEWMRRIHYMCVQVGGWVL